MPLRFAAAGFTCMSAFLVSSACTCRMENRTASLAKSGSSRATRCISFLAFPPDPPCVLWPPASSPCQCLLVGYSRVNLACAWHSTTYRFCGSAFGFSCSTSRWCGLSFCFQSTLSEPFSLGHAVHPLPNGCDALQSLSSVRRTFLQIRSRSLAVGSLEPLALFP